MQSTTSLQTAIMSVAHWQTNYLAAMQVLSANTETDYVPYVIDKSLVCSVLQRTLEGHIDFDELELWANIIEARPEFDCSQIDGVIYALANAEQMGELSNDKLTQLLTLLTPS
ncbi:hypothetical protein ACFOEE_18165 [Pseudoalteromonas fenneropenaei]|uniref:Uncharacterized protein n=1 Tax=Pseudoalteromonas fenneropenaei TaxID=1737459 RepID=A0ABV7CPW3_9GAMM